MSAVNGIMSHGETPQVLPSSQLAAARELITVVRHPRLAALQGCRTRPSVRPSVRLHPFFFSLHLLCASASADALLFSSESWLFGSLFDRVHDECVYAYCIVETVVCAEGSTKRIVLGFSYEHAKTIYNSR